ncbi:MAG: hypothetical protein KAI99_04180 [Cyclobacteriaceae bacterium]|nr:hypothetical protein [Cyclobacteriaceae bacterium]
MKQITLNIPENKYRFFLELVKNLGFIKVKEEDNLSKDQREFIEDLKESLTQVDLHLKGQINLKSADELLGEL